MIFFLDRNLRSGYKPTTPLLFCVFLSLDVVSEFGGRTESKKVSCVLVSFAQMQAETDAL